VSAVVKRRSVTARARDKFLEGLAAGWTVTHAAKRAGHDRRRFYEVRVDDESFAAAWDEANETGVQVLEDELHRRALEGWTEDTFDGDGKLIRRVQRYAPALLLASLRAKRPDLYGDNARVEVTGANGGPLEVAAGYQPPTLVDVLRLARELGLPEAVDGEAHEVSDLPQLDAVAERTVA
jgi:hypothetical protein